MSSSSMDQAFVKAFARRNRPGHQSTGEARLRGNGPVSKETESVNTAESTAPVSTAEPGTLRVDQSVANTAKVWIDPIEDQIARADLAARQVPKPHVDAPIQPAAPESQTPASPKEPSPAAGTVNSLQHIHTAYAAALTEIPILPTAATDPSASISNAVGGAMSTIDAPTKTDAATTNDASSGGTQTTVSEVPVVERAATPEHGVTDIRIDPPAPQARASQSIFPFQPAWEVDVFDIPSTVADLFFEGVLFQQIAERMSDAVANGLRSVLVTSNKKGEGRSSVAIGMAMASAAAGIRVALVDADTEEPTLADDLRLDLQYGWADTIRGGLPIKEVAVHAVEDGVTLIPLMPPSGRGAATAFEIVQLIDLLRQKFELIIIDGPTGASPSIHQCAAAVDSEIIVRDMTRTDAYAINEFSYRLRESGVQGVGVVDNYA